MDSVLNDIEAIRKRFEELDVELDRFFESVREVHDIRDSVSDFEEKIRKHEADIESRQKAIGELLTRTSDFLLNYEERAKGLFFDMEKKTDAVNASAESRLSALEERFGAQFRQLSDSQVAKIQEIASSHDGLMSSFENFRIMIHAHEDSLQRLKAGHDEILSAFERLDLSLKETSRSISELLNRPQISDSRLAALEKELRQEFFTKLNRQKNLILTLLIVLLSGIILFIIYQL